MRKDPIRMVWLIQTDTLADLQEVRALLEKKTDPNFVFLDTVTAGSEERIVREERHRVGDSFESVEVASVLENPRTLRLTFNRRLDAPRYWKDIMVRLLGMAQDAAKNISIDFVSRTDLERPAAVSSTS